MSTFSPASGKFTAPDAPRVRQQARPGAPRAVRGRRAFTLLEVLVSTAVLVVLVGVLAMTMNMVQALWVGSRQNVETRQSGRAALELLAREASAAVVSPRTQFVQTPDLVSKIPGLVAEAPSLFWMVPGQSTVDGNLTEVGYFLTRSDDDRTYQLWRMHVSPDNEDGYYRGANAYEVEPSTARRPYSFANEALWVTGLPAAAFDPDSPSSVVSVVADGVVGLWIRCLDAQGNPIPWLSEEPSYNSDTIQFSSGASFQMPPTGSTVETGESFVYAAGPTETAARTEPANRLPASMEVTMVVAEADVLARAGTVPAMPAPTSPDDIPNQIEAFEQAMIDAGISNAQTFRVRVPFRNAVY